MRWTTRELLRWMGDHFRDRGVDSPRVSAEMLLAHVLGCERMRLYMEVDRPAAPEELDRLRKLVVRAAKHEPVQHLVGHAWFFSRRFEVDGSTLVPRPSTETLVEAAIQWCRERGQRAGSREDVHEGSNGGPSHDGAGTRVLDIGTGTGCIAISVAAQVGDAQIVATDIADAVLALAARNARTHNVADRIEFRQGSLWNAVRDGEQFDIIASNPPYISDVEWADVPPNVRDWEPQRALRGGVDGLDLVRAVIAGASERLVPGGLVLVEIAASQGDAAAALCQREGLGDVRLLRDCDGLPRVVSASRPSMHGR